MSDESLIWEIYRDNLLLEDAQSAKNIIINSYIRSKVGHQIFKFKNKPENKELIDSHRKEVQPIVDKLEKWIIELNPKDKNLNDLQHLFKFYMQLENNPDRDRMLKTDYGDYLEMPSLVNNSTLANTGKFTEWAAEVHSLKQDKAGKLIAGTSNDPNKVYEDENVIVFLANNLENPRESVKNCVRYGKGSSLCISGSNARGYYHEYRWEYKLTTYFCWLKDKQRYMLVDATEDNNFQYNPMFREEGGRLIQYNHDKKASVQEIIKIFPQLKGAFENNAFKSIAIEGKELTFYKKIYETNSILDLKDLEDRINYASLKNITKEEWNVLKDLDEKDLKQIVSIAVETTEVDIPEEILKKFPALQTRYNIVVHNRVEREIEEWDEDDKIEFTPHELDAIFEDKELLNLAIQKIPEYKTNYNLYEEFLKKYSALKETDNTINVFYKYFPLSLPQLQKSGDINASSATSLSLPQLQQSGRISASEATSLSLPQLQKSINIDAPNATSLSLPQLQRSGLIYAGAVTSLSLPQLQQSGDIFADSATNLSLPQLQQSGEINASSATSLSLPQLQKSVNIAALNATSINLPQLQQSGHIFADSATSLSLPQLQRSGNIFADSATSLSLPQLQRSGIIDANSATSLSLPQLQKSEDINAGSAKKIIIKSHLKNKIKTNSNLEIIEPSSEEELNDSTIYDLMKSFLLRS